MGSLIEGLLYYSALVVYAQYQVVQSLAKKLGRNPKWLTAIELKKELETKGLKKRETDGDKSP